MALRHGQGSARIETLQADEQQTGLAVAVAAASGPLDGSVAVARDSASGRVADRHGAAELGRKGGLAKARKVASLRALTGLGLYGPTPASLAPYLDAALEFATAEIERLALECGAGVCPQNACALVQQAALAMAGSRSAYGSGDTALGAKLGIEVRQNLLGARELTVLEAKAARPVNPTARWIRPAQPKDIK